MKKGITLLSLLFCLSVVFAQDLPPASLILKTDLKTGERITIRLAANPADVIIDWGDGAFAEIKVKTAFDSTPTSVGYTLTVDNPTIRIWGRLVNLHAHTSKLTSVELGGNQWDLIRRIDFQNNLLTSLVFPADGGFKTSLGLVQVYNNNLDVCGIEGLYNSLPDKSSTTAFGSLALTGNTTTVEGEGNAAQNEAVKLHSKISLANTRGWNVMDTEALPNTIVTENPTARGCESTGIENVLSNFDFDCYFDASKSMFTVKMKDQLPAGLTRITLYDAMGRTCYTKLLNSIEEHISSAGFSKGVYFVNVGKLTKKVVL